jgi:flavin-dependent dehydrogenase
MLGSGALNERLSEAEIDDASYCAVAGVFLRPERAADEELRIGDAITMIPPIIGNGMSMALESAELAVEPLVSWVGGALGWRQAREAVADGCDRAFSTRLAWAQRLQTLLGLPGLGLALPGLSARRAWLWRFVFARTR